MIKKTIVTVLVISCLTFIGCGSDQVSEQEEPNKTEQALTNQDDEAKTPDIKTESFTYATPNEVVADIENDINLMVSRAKEEYNTLLSEVDTYDKYCDNSALVDTFFANLEEQTNALFDKSGQKSAYYFRLALEQFEDNTNLEQVFEDYYDSVYDAAYENFYEEIYDRLFDDIYDDIYDTMLDEAYDKVPYQEWSEASSDFYNKWSDAHEQAYLAYSNARNKAYVLYTNMRSNALYGDTRDYDTIMADVYETLDKQAEEDQRRQNQVDYEVVYEVRDEKAYVTGISGEGDHATISHDYEGYEVVGIDASAFEGSDIYAITCWADIVTIGDSAFKDCISLQEISIPSTIVVIGNSAFENCSALSDLVIWGDPDIGVRAFANCTGLTELSISSATQKICDQAFDGCTGLTKVVIWGDDTKIGKDAFANCPSLEEAVIESGESVVLDVMTETNTQEEESDTKASENNANKEDNSSSGIREEFQKAMDEYVAFFEEYCKFIKEYKESADPMSLLDDYNDYLKQYTDTMKALEDLGSEEMTLEEQKLYLDTTNQIQKMLLDVI